MFEGFATTATQTEISRLASNRNVDFIVEDTTFYATAQTPSTAVPRIDIEAYAQIDGVNNPANVDIAILDTGIDAAHPDLTVVNQVNFSTDSTVEDLGGHGTHVAGIAGARDNTIGVVGTAPGAKLWNVKVLNAQRTGSLSAIIRGIEYSIDQGSIEVINMSLAGSRTGTSSCANPAADLLHAAVCEATNAGILVVVAAGNDGGDAANTVPAKYPEVVTVGNIADGNPSGAPGGDSYASSSNYGGVVDFSAPGTGIYSTYPNGSYANLTGTSMSSPLVAGAAALYMSKTGASASSARSWLLGSASVPMNTADGCACSAPSGSPTRMLFLGSATSVTNPPGQMTPSFAGSNVPIASSSATMNSAASAKTWDGNTESNWTSGTTPSGQVILTLDLGKNVDISGVKWMTAFNGYADQFTVRGINSSYQSRTLGKFGNPGQTRTFYGVGVPDPVVVRWIKFYFDNPNLDSVVGSISEIQVW
ncbi:MAG: S8 family peptidase, partial [Thermomicrobiales bacterium]